MVNKKPTKEIKKTAARKKTIIIASIIVAVPLVIVSVIHACALIQNQDWTGTYDWATTNELVISKKNKRVVTVDLKALGGCVFHGLTNEDKEIRGCSWTRHDAKYGGNPSIKMTIDFGSTKKVIIVKKYYNELQPMHEI